MEYTIVPVTPFQQNATVLWCPETRHAAIVDPGGDLPQILAAIESRALVPEKILITHGHIDHAGGAAELAGRLGVPIEGPQIDDKFWIDGMPGQSRMFGFPEVLAFTPDRWLAHGDRVTVGRLELEVIHCPGHSPGHVCFYHAPSRLALVGDVLFQGSIGRTDFPKGDYATLIASIKERLLPLGDDVEFIPGHGPMSDFGEERRYNPFLGS